ncbi:hypothetical protein [Leadbetterella byssophila]|uniref:hypothetical protein n=1 Tax=Leadbetterella byssophila TaxID=316068 RepID=UPI0039A05B1E
MKNVDKILRRTYFIGSVIFVLSLKYESSILWHFFGVVNLIFSGFILAHSEPTLMLNDHYEEDNQDLKDHDADH